MSVLVVSWKKWGVSEVAESEWDRHVTAALFLVRDLRVKAIRARIDPRALRVALKYALIVDTHCMRAHGFSSEDDQKITETAKELFKKTPKTALMEL